MRTPSSHRIGALIAASVRSTAESARARTEELSVSQPIATRVPATCRRDGVTHATRQVDRGNCYACLQSLLVTNVAHRTRHSRTVAARCRARRLPQDRCERVVALALCKEHPMIALRTITVATAVGIGLGSAPLSFAQGSALGAGSASAPVTGVPQKPADANSLGAVFAYSRDRPERQQDRVDRAERPGSSVARSTDGSTSAHPPRDNGTQPKE